VHFSSATGDWPTPQAFFDAAGFGLAMRLLARLSPAPSLSFNHVAMSDNDGWSVPLAVVVLARMLDLLRARIVNWISSAAYVQHKQNRA